MKGLMVKIEKVWSIVRKNGLLSSVGIILKYFSNYFRSMAVFSGDILIVTDGVGDSAHYRARNVSEELNLHGFRCAFTVSDNPFLLSFANKFKMFVFHKTVFSSKIEKLIEKIKNQKKEIVFDSDDLVFDEKHLASSEYLKNAGDFEKEQFGKGKGAEIINDPYVKVCSATTSYLAEVMRNRGKKVFVVKNKVSNRELEIAEEILKSSSGKNDGYVRMGYYSGTMSHNKDFAEIIPALSQILEKYPRARLCLAGPLDTENRLNEYFGRVDILPFIPRDKYYENLYKSDINLAPLVSGDPFCEAKSEIKFIEAGILGIPTVAVKNQTFFEAIEDGADGFLAADTGEWVEKIGRLIENKELREKMGEKARQKVLRDYTNKNSHNEEYYAYLKSKLQGASNNK